MTKLEITEGFNYYIQRLEDFSFKIGKIEIGLNNKTLKFYRTVTSIFVLVMGSLWVLTGYEGTIHYLLTQYLGISLPEGIGLHFGTLILIASSFVVTSFILEKIGIKKLRNILYSFILSTGFMNGLFEVPYALLYDIIHHGELWITAPFLYTKQFAFYPTIRNFYWFIFGFIFLWFIKEHYGKYTYGKGFHKLGWRNPLKDKKLFFIMCILAVLWLSWIFYPQNGFMKVRNSYFPQYIYGFREYETIPEWIPQENIVTLLETGWKAVYVSNLGVRLINEITKVFHFIFFTYLFIPKWKRVK